MAQIDVLSSTEEFIEFLKKLDYPELLAQNIAQQSAIHAVSFFLKQGATEKVAVDMLASLRHNAGLIREETKRRGIEDPFEKDQTGFT